MGGRYCAINSPLGPRWGQKSLDLRSRDFCPPPWTSWWVNCAIPTAHVVSLYTTLFRSSDNNQQHPWLKKIHDKRFGWNDVFEYLWRFDSIEICYIIIWARCRHSEENWLHYQPRLTHWTPWSWRCLKKETAIIFHRSHFCISIKSLLRLFLGSH